MLFDYTISMDIHHHNYIKAGSSCYLEIGRLASDRNRNVVWNIYMFNMK